MSKEDDCQMVWSVDKKDQMPNDADRLLILIYKLSDGKAGVPINEDLIILEASRIGLFNMSDSEFDIWRNKVLLDIKVNRN